MKFTEGPWRYEKSTKTIRSVPGNHWLATMDSWDGADDHAANANLIACAPEILAALENLLDMVTDMRTHGPEVKFAADVIYKARGE